MDVSKLHPTVTQGLSAGSSPESVNSPGGEELLHTVANMSGLPPTLAVQELNDILEFSGCESRGLTLDELRAAMLTYLEALQEEMSASGDESLRFD